MTAMSTRIFDLQVPIVWKACKFFSVTYTDPYQRWNTDSASQALHKWLEASDVLEDAIICNRNGTYRIYVEASFLHMCIIS